MHLDPDFEHVTYGDQARKGKQVVSLSPGDLLVFFAGLRAVDRSSLWYALIGMLVVDRVERAVDVPVTRWTRNAHTRRVLDPKADDVIVTGVADCSGRFEKCIPIGEYRDRAYRVRRDLLDAWGGLSVRDGYLQRSGTLPSINDVDRFSAWLHEQRPQLVRSNW